MAIMIKEGLLQSSSGTEAGDSSHISIRKISEISLEGFLTIDQRSFRALQIFQVRFSS